MASNERMYELKRRVGQIAADGMGSVLRLAGPRNYRFIAERLHGRIHDGGFEREGIRYYADPCSVGRTPQGELTGESAAEFVRERGLSGLHVLDICSGIGLVGLTMLSRLKGTDHVARMSFADINIFNINSLRRTLTHNPPDAFGGVDVEVFLSDNLKGIPAQQQFDLIVSNPPHFDARSFTEGDLDPVGLGNADPAWQFHREFYRAAHEYLSASGEVWFFENGEASSVELLRPFVEENDELEYVDSIQDRRDERFYWMVTRRKVKSASERVPSVAGAQANGRQSP